MIRINDTNYSEKHYRISENNLQVRLPNGNWQYIKYIGDKHVTYIKNN